PVFPVAGDVLVPCCHRQSTGDIASRSAPAVTQQPVRDTRKNCSASAVAVQTGTVPCANRTLYGLKASRPAYVARLPSSASIRSKRLYLAKRSERDSDPVLICVAGVATARSAIVASSVSPERWETTAV